MNPTQLVEFVGVAAVGSKVTHGLVHTGSLRNGDFACIMRVSTRAILQHTMYMYVLVGKGLPCRLVPFASFANGPRSSLKPKVYPKPCGLRPQPSVYDLRIRNLDPG